MPDEEVDKIKQINYWDKLLELIESWSLQCKAENVRYFLKDFGKYLDKILNGETFMNKNETVSEFATQNVDRVETAFDIINAADEIKQKLFDKFKEQLNEIAKEPDIEIIESSEKFHLPNKTSDYSGLDFIIKSTNFKISIGFEDRKLWIGGTTKEIFKKKTLTADDQLFSERIIEHLKGYFDNIKPDPGWLFSHFYNDLNIWSESSDVWKKIINGELKKRLLNDIETIREALLKIENEPKNAHQISLHRYLLIVNKLQKRKANFKTIHQWLEREAEINNQHFTFSQRTFQRDIQNIRRLFNIEIFCTKATSEYSISDNTESNLNNAKLLASYEFVHIMHTTSGYADHLFFEKRRLHGMEYFSSLLHATKNKLIINIKYNKFYDDEDETFRKLYPLALKESAKRWYLIAIDTKSDVVKTYGLDRIADLEISKTQFTLKQKIDLEALFKNSFGIITSAKPVKVILLFSYHQGQYIKTYPLHESQKLIKETLDDVIFELNICITYDFIMELLSHGKELTVISPTVLIKEIALIFSELNKKYIGSQKTNINKKAPK